MLESFEDLASRLTILSNHYQKYLLIAQRNTQLLRQKLEKKGQSGRVHLWRPAQNYLNEMHTIMQVADGESEIRTFLGTYVSLQTLHLHFINIDRLRRETSNYQNRNQIFGQMLIKLRFSLRDLISSYLACLIRLFSPENASLSGIAMCNMGMILDQDDLDVGIFIDESVDPNLWNRVIGHTSTEMLKYCRKMHFYLAERVSDGSYLTTLSDVKGYLDRSVSNFVVISELLLTELLIGDGELKSRINAEIIDSFYLDIGQRRFHEGYLRGMLGEVKENLTADIFSSYITPKTHGLRLIHSLVNMLKTMYGIREHGSRDTLDILITKDSALAPMFRQLKDIFNFIEMFFYVYQLIVSVEEELDMSDALHMENLDQVAIVMGFPKLGLVRPALRLLTHYYETLDQLRSIANSIVEKVNEHLKAFTIIRLVMEGRYPDDYATRWHSNKAINVLRIFKMYRGLIYWDDVLEMLAENDGQLLNHLVRSIHSLKESSRLKTFERLLKLLILDMDSMIISGVLFDQYIRDPELISYVAFLRTWLNQKLEANVLFLGSLIPLIRTHASYLTKYLLSLDYQLMVDLIRIVRKNWKSIPCSIELKSKFLFLCELLAFSSNNYRRLYSKVAQAQPEIVYHINDNSFLNGLSLQLWTELSDATTSTELKFKLATYYNYSFCRCGLKAIENPKGIRSLYEEYHSFFRRYFRRLFRACLWAIDEKNRFPFHFSRVDEDDQPIGIFCTGGYAREEAFENDIDLFVISTDSSPHFLKYASAVINDINRELIHQGILPHHRFGELIGTFVISLETLENELQKPDSLRFINFSQLLGSRLLSGNRSTDDAIKNLLQKYLFADPGWFINDMFDEISSRRDHSSERSNERVNVKEDPGALRDIQLAVGAVQANLGLRQPVMWRAFEELRQQFPILRNEFNAIERAYQFMRGFKDSHVLSLANGEEMATDRLRPIARRMGIENSEPSEQEDGNAPKLMSSYTYYKQRARTAIKSIEEYLRE